MSDKSDKVEIGSRVRQSRHARGMTQEQLAARAGITHTTVYRIERGMVRPTLDSLFEIAAALDVDPKWLRGGDEERGESR